MLINRYKVIDFFTKIKIYFKYGEFSHDFSKMLNYSCTLSILLLIYFIVSLVFYYLL